MRRSLTKKERLARRSDIDRVFKLGQRRSFHGGALISRPNGLSYSRIVVTFKHRVFNSVQRNRLRRVSKETFRLWLPSLPGRVSSLDVVVVLLSKQKALERDLKVVLHDFFDRMSRDLTSAC